MEAGRWLQQIWPGMIILSVCDPESGKTLRSLTLPESKFSTRFYPSADLEGVFVPHVYTLSYWSFVGATTWPNWLGLGIGVVLATMLARENLVLPPRRKGTSAQEKPFTA